MLLSTRRHFPAWRVAPLVMLLTRCATLPPLLPEPSTMVSPSGVKVELKIEGEALALQIWNQTPWPLSVMPSAIKLLKDKQFFTPSYSEELRILPPGAQLPLRLRYFLDGFSLRDGKDTTLHLGTALSQGGQRIALAPFRLVRNLEANKTLAGPHISLLGGYAYNYFYSTDLQGGFVELRFGGHIDAIELTGRARLQLGKTEGGQSVSSATLSFGLLRRLHARVWLGFELSSPPPMSWLFVHRSNEVVSDFIMEAAPELRVDLARGQKQVLFLTARPGFRVSIASFPAFISPNILVGIGYGYEHLTRD